jgi:ABC-type dipeptide/oligopeptide/nickel transport system permease component
MLKFLLRRLLAVPITFLVITAVLYGIIMLSPAETRAQLYFPPRTRTFMPEHIYQNTVDRIIREHHLDESYLQQYFYWLSHVVRGDWGYSPIEGTAVLDALLIRTPATAELTLYSLLLLVPLGLVSGVAAASKEESLADSVFRVVAYCATAVPPFILGLVLLSLFYVGLHWFPPGRLDVATRFDPSTFRTYTGLLTVDGLLNSQYDVALEAARHLALPVVTLSLAHWATLGRVMRATMIEELGKVYIVAARARGLRRRAIVWRHAFLNAAPAALTSTALSAASLVTGVFVIEAVFAFPGVSKLIVHTMSYTPDAPMALGFAVYCVVIVLLLMFALDVLQAIINPWIREEVIAQ